MVYENKHNELHIIYSKIYTEEANLENKYKKEEKNAERRITIRVTEKEFNDINIKAKAAGMSKTELIKKAISNSNIIAVDPAITAKIVELDEKINQLSCSEKQDTRAEFNALKDDVFAGLIGG